MQTQPVIAYFSMEIAFEEGMPTLRMDGVTKMINGVTTIDEVIKETVAAD